MKLGTAIEVLTFFSGTRTVRQFNYLLEATKLGIEALKFKRALADSPYGPRYEQLPGETIEK